MTLSCSNPIEFESPFQNYPFYRIAAITDTHLREFETFRLGNAHKIQINESMNVFEEVVEICNQEKADYLLHAGDLFHHRYYHEDIGQNAQAIWDKSTFPMCVVAGNHDPFFLSNDEKPFCAASVFSKLYPDTAVNRIHVFHILKKQSDTLSLKPLTLLEPKQGLKGVAVYGMHSYDENYLLDPNVKLNFEKLKYGFDQYYVFLLVHQSCTDTIFRQLQIKCEGKVDFVIIGHYHHNESLIHSTNPQFIQLGSPYCVSSKTDQANRPVVAIFDITPRGVEIRFIPLQRGMKCVTIRPRESIPTIDKLDSKVTIIKKSIQPGQYTLLQNDFVKKYIERSHGAKNQYDVIVKLQKKFPDMKFLVRFNPPFILLPPKPVSENVNEWKLTKGDQMIVPILTGSKGFESSKELTIEFSNNDASKILEIGRSSGNYSMHYKEKESDTIFILNVGEMNQFHIMMGITNKFVSDVICLENNSSFTSFVIFQGMLNEIKMYNSKEMSSDAQKTFRELAKVLGGREFDTSFDIFNQPDFESLFTEELLTTHFQEWYALVLALRIILVDTFSAKIKLLVIPQEYKLPDVLDHPLLKSIQFYQVMPPQE